MSKYIYIYIYVWGISLELDSILAGSDFGIFLNSFLFKVLFFCCCSMQSAWKSCEREKRQDESSSDEWHSRRSAIRINSIVLVDHSLSFSLKYDGKI